MTILSPPPFQNSEAEPEAALATRRKPRLLPDPRRVVAELFVPGEEVPESESRAAAVIARILALDESTVRAAYRRTLERFGERHRDLEDVFANHFETVGHRVERGTQVSETRQRLIGAYFTHEYSVEAAALTNPSIVAHPDQEGLDPGELRFLMSVREIGEGHQSSIGFRTGTVSADGEVAVDEPVPFASAGRSRAPLYRREYFEIAMDESGDDDEVFAYLRHNLPDRFTGMELEVMLSELPSLLMSRQWTHGAVERIHWIAACRYELEFSERSDVSERVLRPIGPTERRGMEDARFVRFVDDGGVAGYRATYTAFDGQTTVPQLIETDDFRTFQISQLLGPAAQNKGLALFPRLVGGVHFALSRWDRESTSIATSPNGRVWADACELHLPALDWDLVQLGNCGSPIETAEGWLVLTHGVGPMRTYSIGAILLDLEDPHRVIAALPEPLLVPDDVERDGYVPNVVYSCGSLRHGDTLVIPYGFSDTGIGFATVSIEELIQRMTG